MRPTGTLSLFDFIFQVALSLQIENACYRNLKVQGAEVYLQFLLQLFRLSLCFGDFPLFTSIILFTPLVLI